MSKALGMGPLCVYMSVCHAKRHGVVSSVVCLAAAQAFLRQLREGSFQTGCPSPHREITVGQLPVETVSCSGCWQLLVRGGSGGGS